MLEDGKIYLKVLIMSKEIELLVLKAKNLNYQAFKNAWYTS
jgi:hypothetical protein